MKVILLQELKGKGGEGDVIDVADGFANNYLLKEGYAIKATKGNLKQLEARKHNIAKREVTRVGNAESMKAALEGATIKIVAQVGEEGQLNRPDDSRCVQRAGGHRCGQAPCRVEKPY